MSRLGGWFRGYTPKSSNGPSPSTSQVKLRAEAIAILNDAIAGVDLIMNDDIDGADERLRKGNSTYHSFGLAVCAFMKSILGFEKSFMTEAGNRLSESETSAWNEIKKAEKEASGLGSQPGRIYPPGSEYQLVLAESYLMSAIIGVLHESLTEGIKSFYKLRKAYAALDSIIQAENAYLKKRGMHSTSSKHAPQHERMPGGFGDEEEFEFLDEDEDEDEPHTGDQTPQKDGDHVANGDINEAEKTLGGLSLNGNNTKEKTEPPRDLPSALGGSPDSDMFADPVDAFIHS
ncbi:hypothetical protein ONZ43_g7312 [Nemania bipapillata]|uniref:Uncharacterized protein n=1 Tax=Nemania bipapillata TaxID=110536 RepID=A0ACC2HS71_9PEZI|nr:hypothetical protein ONZ43_g7312 [Nemania bipapillata]